MQLRSLQFSVHSVGVFLLASSATISATNVTTEQFQALSKPIHFAEFSAMINWVDNAESSQQLDVLQEILAIKITTSQGQLRPFLDYLLSRFIDSSAQDTSRDATSSSDQRLKTLFSRLDENIANSGRDIDQNYALSGVLEWLAIRYPEQLLVWIENEQALKHSYTFLNTVLSKTATSLPEQTLKYALSLPAGSSQRDLAVIHTLQTLSNTRPTMAAELFSEHLSVDSQLLFLDLFFEGPIKASPDAALEVITRLPDSIDPRTYLYTEAKVRSWISIPKALAWAATPAWGTEEPSPYPTVLAEWLKHDFDAVLTFCEDKVEAGKIEFARHAVFAVMTFSANDKDQRERTTEWLDALNLPTTMASDLYQALALGY